MSTQRPTLFQGHLTSLPDSALRSMTQEHIWAVWRFEHDPEKKCWTKPPRQVKNPAARAR